MAETIPEVTETHLMNERTAPKLITNLFRIIAYLLRVWQNNRDLGVDLNPCFGGANASKCKHNYLLVWILDIPLIRDTSTGEAEQVFSFARNIHEVARNWLGTILSLKCSRFVSLSPFGFLQQSH